MRVEAQEADGRLVGGILAEADAPEPSRVRHHQLAAVVEDQLELREAGRPCVIRPFPTRLELDARPARRGVEAARHAEVETRPGAAVELEPQVLAVAAQRPHAAAYEGFTEASGRHALEDNGIVGAARLPDAAALGDLHGDLAAVLDLGKLGHRADHTPGSSGILGLGRSGDPRSA